MNDLLIEVDLPSSQVTEAPLKVNKSFSRPSVPAPRSPSTSSPNFVSDFIFLGFRISVHSLQSSDGLSGTTRWETAEGMEQPVQLP